jgi:peptidyl-prolyl cis-trans isomerase D
MLQWLRDNLKSLSWTLWLVIAAFVIFYIPDLLNQSGAASAPATVGDQKITVDEFRRAYRTLEDNYRQYFGERFTPEMAKQLHLPMQALNQLVARKVLVAEARRLGLAVGDRELQRAILKAGFVDESGHFMGDARYAQAVHRMGFATPADFEESVREDLLVGKLQAVMSANLFIPDSEVEKSFREQVEKARIRYAQLPAGRFAAEVRIGDQDLATYYQERREEYRQPEKRVASYLLVDQFRLRPTIEVAAADVQAYYDQHPDEFKVEEQVHARHILLRVDDRRSDEEARAQLAAIRRRIEGGEDFAAVAREVSEDPGSKDRGGDLGFFGRGQMVPEFEQAAFDAQPGQLVGPIHSGLGYHLIEVLAHRQGGEKPFAEVEAQIRFRLQNDRAASEADARIKDLAAHLKQQTVTSDEPLAALAKDSDEVSFATTTPFARQEAISGLGRAPDFSAAAFSLSVGALSEPVKVPRGWAILRLDEVHEPAIPPLAEVEGRVRQALLREKEQALADAALTAARQRIEAGATFAAAVAPLGVEVAQSDEFGHGGTIQGLGANPGVVDAALAMAEGEVGGPVKTAQGAVLFQVAERKGWDAEEFARQRDQIRDNLERQELDRMLGAFIEERRRQPDVQVNTQQLKALGIVDTEATE